MSKYEDFFFAEQVDEQLDTLISEPETLLITELRTVYREDKASLEHVRLRLLGRLAERRQYLIGEGSLPHARSPLTPDRYEATAFSSACLDTGRPTGEKGSPKQETPELVSIWLLILTLLGALGLFTTRLAFQATDVTTPGTAYYWLGIGCIFLPGAFRLLMKSTPRLERIALLCVVTFYLIVSKVAPGPFYFSSYETLFNWQTIVSILRDAHLPLSSTFPGLEIIASEISNIGALNSTQAGAIVVGIVSLLMTLSLFLLSEYASGSAYLASVITLVSLINPHIFFVGGQFRNEVLFLPLATTILFVLAHCAISKRSQYWIQLANWLILVVDLVYHATGSVWPVAISVLVVLCIRVITHVQPIKHTFHWRSHVLSGAALCLLCISGMLLQIARSSQAFASSYLITSEAYATTMENTQAARWMSIYEGKDKRVYTDRVNQFFMTLYSEQALAQDGDDNTTFFLGNAAAPGFDKHLTGFLRQTHTQFLEVDLRFIPPELCSSSRASPVVGQAQASSLEKMCLTTFDAVPGINRLFDSGQIIIYDTGGLLYAP